MARARRRCGDVGRGMAKCGEGKDSRMAPV